MSDFQRGLQARLAHLIGEASQWSRGSGAHPPKLVKALDEALEYVTAEIERLREKVEDQKRETLSAVLNVIDYAIGGLTHTDGRPNWAIDSRDAAILNVLRDVRAQVAELAEGRSDE